MEGSRGWRNEKDVGGQCGVKLSYGLGAWLSGRVLALDVQVPEFDPQHWGRGGG